MIRPINEIEDLLMSITKKCERLIHQTRTRPQETHDFKSSNQEKHFISIHLLILFLTVAG